MIHHTEDVKAKGIKTVGQLVKALTELDPDLPVILMDHQNDETENDKLAKELLINLWVDEYGSICYIDTHEFYDNRKEYEEKYHLPEDLY